MHFSLSSNYVTICYSDTQPDEKTDPYCQETNTESKILHTAVLML